MNLIDLKWLRTVASALLWMLPLATPAQQYPSKPIRIIVPYPPGAFNDVLGRTLAQKFTETWGQPALVDNRPGGNTIIGVDAAARAAPDGYTLLIVAFPYAVLPSLYARLPFDPIKSLQPVIYAGDTASLLVVHPAVPASSVKELLALARTRPGQLTYASAGNGSSSHIAMELFKSLAHVSLTHIPYKGIVPAGIDLVSGQLDVMFSNLPNVVQYVRAGKMRALAVSGARRSLLVPEVPTVAEAGVPGFELLVWFGMMAPADVPKEVITKLNAEINRILQIPDIREKFLAQGVEPVGGSAEQFGLHIRDQVARWGKVVRDAGVKPE